MHSRSVAFARLRALLSKGYLLDEERSYDEFIELVHPRTHRVEIWPDGEVVLPDDFLFPIPDPPVEGYGALGQRTFRPDDADGFAAFLRTVKRPTFYDLHGRPWKIRAQVIGLWFLLMLVLSYGSHWLGATLFGWDGGQPGLMAVVATLPLVVVVLLTRKPIYY